MPGIDTIVDISTRIASGGVPAEAFGRGLLITLDTGLSAGGADKVQLISSVDSAEDIFSGDAALAAARIWFGAEGGPQPLWAARWANVDVPTVLSGGTPGMLSDVQNSRAGFIINGNEADVNTSGGATLTAVAALIQAEIQAFGGEFAGATFTYSTDRFVLTLAGADEIDAGAFTAPTTTGVVDITEALGMDADSNPTYLQGSDAETITQAITAAIGEVDTEPQAIMFAGDVPATDPQSSGQSTVTLVSAYVEAADDIMFSFTDTAAQAVVTGDTTSLSALAIASEQRQVAPVWSSRADQLPHVGALAALSAQNLDLPASIITVHGKPLPGVLPSTVTAEQLTELRRKRTNVYRTIGGRSRFDGGTVARDGGYMDAVWWLAWMKNRMTTAIWNSISSPGTRRFTTALLEDLLIETMQAGVSNGGIQPGRTVSAPVRADIAATTNVSGFDGMLPTGYLVWVDRNPSQADRDNRIGRFKVWATGSDAIHRVFGDLSFIN